MKGPLPVVSIALCAGIAIAAATRLGFVPMYLAAACLCLAACVTLERPLAFDIFLVLLALCAGCLLYRNSTTLPGTHLSRLGISGHCLLQGVVAKEAGDTLFVLESARVYYRGIPRRCCGRVLVRLKEKREFLPGDSLEIYGTLRTDRPGYAHSGYARYLANRGIHCTFRAGRIVSYAGRWGPAYALQRLSIRIKKRLQQGLYAQASAMTAGILAAVVLGDKKGVPPAVYRAMAKNGTVHILVVSGFNVGIVAGLVMLVLKLLRLKRAIRCVLAVPLLICYCLVTGASEPVVRATVMALVFLLSYIFRRESDVYVSLSLAALVIVVAHPGQLFDVGFQLSFASVISIVCLYPRFNALLRLDCLRCRPVRYLLAASLVSLSAWLGTAALVARYFRFVSWTAVLANLCIVPLASFLTLSGFALIFISLAAPALAPAFAACCESAVMLLLFLNGLFLRLPFACLSLPP